MVEMAYLGNGAAEADRDWIAAGEQMQPLPRPEPRASGASLTMLYERLESCTGAVFLVPLPAAGYR